MTFFHHFCKLKSLKEWHNRRNQGFSYYFCMIEWSWTGSIPLTNGGSGSRRPKISRIRRGFKTLKCKKFKITWRAGFIAVLYSWVKSVCGLALLCSRTSHLNRKKYISRRKLIQIPHRVLEHFMQIFYFFFNSFTLKFFQTNSIFVKYSFVLNPVLPYCLAFKNMNNFCLFYVSYRAEP